MTWLFFAVFARHNCLLRRFLSTAVMGPSMFRLFRHTPNRVAIHEVYRALVVQARLPQFYADHGVPDTLDGRFDMILLHVFLVLHRLSNLPEAQRFGQALYDTLFADMDRSLREMGIGDLSVGVHVKRMAMALAGRIAAYDAALAGGEDLGLALKRNLYGTAPDPAQTDLDFMTDYLRRQAVALGAQGVDAILGGEISFAAIERLDLAPANVEH
jgi:cytochrome b pre-mRNA-processing protein 3